MGHLRRYLEAFVDGARVHHRRVRLGPSQTLLVHLIQPNVLPHARQEPRLLTLELQAQHHHHIRPLDRPVEVRIHLYRRQHPVLIAPIAGAEPPGQESGRPTEHHLSAHRGQAPDVGARDAAVQDVADDHHLLAPQIAQMVLDSVGIQQALSGVGMPAVAGVDNVHVDVAGHQIGRPRLAMAHHKDVRPDGLEGARAID